jgi:Putative MetA-pathway of phenol degradation
MTIFKLEGVSNMSGLHKCLIAVVAVAVVVALAPAEARAQGCVASRIESPSGPTDPEGNSYVLAKGKWQANVGYEGYRSHRHFVGSVEQDADNLANGTAAQDRAGTEVINHMNLPSFTASYGLTDRLTLSANLPYLAAARRSPVSGSRPSYETHSSGISDLTVSGRFWLGNPEKHKTSNVSVGLGIKAPTGSDTATDSFLISVDPKTGAQTTAVKLVDQSIMPGDGGWGITAEVTAFKAFGKVVAYGSASYLSNPKEQDSTLRDTTVKTQNPLTEYLSVVDQYSARAGIATTFNKLGVSLGMRAEGVPSSDLIGGNLGFRRPGYSVAIEPGISYSFKRSSLSLSVPYLVYRNRTQSNADIVATQTTGKFTQGDAAYADVVVIAGYSLRF